MAIEITEYLHQIPPFVDLLDRHQYSCDTNLAEQLTEGKIFFICCYHYVIMLNSCHLIVGHPSCMKILVHYSHWFIQS